MCGICGEFSFERRRPVRSAELEAMNRQIVHRGPDDGGTYISENVGLAMRRLKIIDLSTGHQPLCNEDSSIWIVFNGEIYNHLDLRRELEARGHQFRTRTDTETIVHLYEDLGPECVTRLEGMFAFALWDARQRRFFAARDPLGIKPFYYHRDGERLLFGSEIKALLAHSSMSATLARETIPEYLAFGYVSGASTMFRGVQKLMPGHRLVANESGAVTLERYWTLPAPSQGRRKPRADYVREYRDRLEGAVRSHLMSDVPLGVFLSGGLDSSAVAALAQRLRGEPLDTFSVGYEESGYSELPYAAEVARHIGSRHHEVRVGCDQFLSTLPKLIWHEDEPVCWPSSVSLYFVAQLARKNVTVVLTGEGSDETLAGYTRYAFTLWNARADRGYRALVPAGLRRALRNQLAGAASLPGMVRHSCLAHDGAQWSSFYFDNFYAAFSAAAQSSLLAPQLRSQAGEAYRNSLECWNHASGGLVRRMLQTDLDTYLVELLMKQDNMSMAASIESRVPFLDRKLVEFALEIPAEFQIRGLAGKMILKDAVADLLPAAIIHRKKMGFPTPWDGWLRGPALDPIEALVCSPAAMDRGLLDPAAVRRLFAEHRAGAPAQPTRIWRLLNLELWHRVFMDHDPAYAPEQAHSCAEGGRG